MNVVRRRLRKLWSQSKRTIVLVAGTAVFVGLAIYSVQLTRVGMPVDPAVYRPLLELIARAESNGNYNAYFGNAANTEIIFTEMTIAEVMQWQRDYVQQGAASSAVGRYQIIDRTLAGLVEQLNLDTSEKFSQPMQDRMAVALLERRGARDFIYDAISREQFAANLAQEWAALPKVIGDNPHESYYASDGLNQSRVAVDEILAVIDRVDGAL